MRLGHVLLLNILLAIIWAAFQSDVGPGEVLFGFVVSFILLALLSREYGRRVLAVISFTIFLLWSIFKSSLQVAALILAPRPALDQGIVAIPLDAQSDLEISTLATAITLTPGTLSVDVARNPQGERVLYVHSLTLGDPVRMRQEIKEEFEQRILRFTRGRKAA
jgi:multicomponent Na+:H+ antiporter subunit E